MVWDGGSEPFVVPTSWALLGVALGGALVWPSSGGVGFTEKSVVRRPPCYLPLGQLKRLQLRLCGGLCISTNALALPLVTLSQHMVHQFLVQVRRH